MSVQQATQQRLFLAVWEFGHCAPPTPPKACTLFMSGRKWVRRERSVGWDRRSRPKIWPLDQDEAALAAYFLELVSFQLTDFAIVFGTHGSVSISQCGGPFRRHAGILSQSLNLLL
jgi:hypothetical protein